MAGVWYTNKEEVHTHDKFLKILLSEISMSRKNFRAREASAALSYTLFERNIVNYTSKSTNKQIFNTWKKIIELNTLHCMWCMS